MANSSPTIAGPSSTRSTTMSRAPARRAPGASKLSSSRRENEMSTPSSSTLIAKGLQKSYGTRQVVHDVSLKVKNGEVVGLLGPNGAGKTTSFYMIVGLVPSDGGEIDLDGVDISRLPIHQRAVLGLSYLPQEASVFRKLTVEDNIRAVLEL